jgi:NADH-quinone oxidoreductase subunit H
MMVDALQVFLQGLFGSVFPLVWALLKIVLIIAPLLLCVAYLTFWERKVIGWMQVRVGPNRVGPWGLIQPIADGLKLSPEGGRGPDRVGQSVSFVIAPMFAFAPALAAWAVVPFNDTLVLANVNASLLYVMAIGSIGVYGIILAGWASNSKYAFSAACARLRR